MITRKYFKNNEIYISNESWSYNNYTWGEEYYNLDSVNYFASLIRNEDKFRVLDIGAQSGLFTLLAKFFPRTTWYAFEPDQKSFMCLVDNLRINNVNNVVASNFAIDASSGEKILHVCENHSGLNTLGQNPSSSNSYKETKVHSNSLDNLFPIVKVDLIKIDTEGCEYNILSGAKNMIDRCKPKIFMEYYQDNLKQFNVSLGDLELLIGDTGYNITHKKNENVLIEPKNVKN
jgi:FkbM family methyltransferase